MEGRLVGGRGGEGLRMTISMYAYREREETHVIKHILATNVEERAAEVGVRHLEGVVEAPERGAERVGDAGETTARGLRVGQYEYEYK